MVGTAEQIFQLEARLSELTAENQALRDRIAHLEAQLNARAAWNLATRLRHHADQVLRLLDDTRVPFDNNNAERALRMVKLHDKISGTFRSDSGAEAFATIRSYIQTAALNGHNRLDVLRQLFKTGAWLPAYPAGAT